MGVSFDSPKDNSAFAKKLDFPFLLLSDEDRKIALAYGAAADKTARVPKRVTFLIGPDQIITRVWDKVDVNTHAQDVLAALP